MGGPEPFNDRCESSTGPRRRRSLSHGPPAGQLGVRRRCGRLPHRALLAGDGRPRARQSPRRSAAPAYGGPGGLPLNIELLVRELERQLGARIDWWEVALAAFRARSWLDAVEDHWERGPGARMAPAARINHNLGIYGWELRDTLELTAARVAARIDEPTDAPVRPGRRARRRPRRLRRAGLGRRRARPDAAARRPGARAGRRRGLRPRVRDRDARRPAGLQQRARERGRARRGVERRPGLPRRGAKGGVHLALCGRARACRGRGAAASPPGTSSGAPCPT